ncbi:MAG: hypothetical protein EP338_02200 [Bacteroidetes bacterium]|nr:MAG: hypothetical protein EP338_02200 [Bacteroidota bacterium]
MNSRRPVFGVQVSMQPNSGLYMLVAYTHNGRALTNRKIMRMDEFIKIATGFWPSVYNPKRENLLEQHGLPCGLVTDPITNKKTPACGPLDSLWKIRYSDFPFNTGNERGWSQELYKPSSKQAVYLHQNYNIYDIDFSPFIDSNFWKILRDVQDPNWVRKYKSL